MLFPDLHSVLTCKKLVRKSFTSHQKNRQVSCLFLHPSFFLLQEVILELIGEEGYVYSSLENSALAACTGLTGQGIQKGIPFLHAEFAGL